MRRHSTPRTGNARRSRAGGAAVLSLVVLGLAVRRESKPAFGDALRRFNRRWFNPLMLRLAGRTPWPLARLEHVVRRSGQRRTTPLLALPVARGFVMPMPYGPDVDWAKNLLHEGRGVVQHRGVRYRVGAPRVASARSAAGELPWLTAAVQRVLGLRQVMRVDILTTLTAEVSIDA